MASATRTSSPRSSVRRPALSGTSLYLFLDDLGAGPDNDHDDMWIRIDIASIAAVPLPAAAGLTGTALAVLMLIGRRRRKS